jgi:hypothetical protein
MAVEYLLHGEVSHSFWGLGGNLASVNSNLRHDAGFGRVEHLTQ